MQEGETVQIGLFATLRHMMEGARKRARERRDGGGERIADCGNDLKTVTGSIAEMRCNFRGK